MNTHRLATQTRFCHICFLPLFFIRIFLKKTLRISCGHDTLSLLSSLAVFPKNKDILLHNHYTRITIRKFTLILCCYLISVPQSDFAHCLHNVFVNPQNSQTMHCIQLSGPLSLLFSGQFPHMFFFHNLAMVGEHRPVM